MKRFFGAIALLLVGASAPAQWHSADTAVPQGNISLSELLRVVQFYNSPGFHCQPGTEDGFAPGPGDETCLPHDLDYNPNDWEIRLLELLRLIQYYNLGGYSLCPSEGTEDGYCPFSTEAEGEGEGGVEGEVFLPCTATAPCVAQSVANWPVSPVDMIEVPSSLFSMGRPYSDVGFSDELPVHPVTLSGYRIGKFEITNAQFAEVLTWAYRKCLLTCSDGKPYIGGTVYSRGKPIAEVSTSSRSSSILFNGTEFVPQVRVGAAEVVYLMEDHPVVEVSWYGAVAWCNWRSEIDGLEPCYNLSDWSRYTPVRNGYRLPTEAEWERAAAWDGTQHLRYGFSNDALETKRANYYVGDGVYANPLGLTADPFTTPVGWFDGVNISPNGDVQTVNSPTAIGAYDMCGNVMEWCEDWYVNNFYGNAARTNPVNTTPSNGRILRGGGFNYDFTSARAAFRNRNAPQTLDNGNGFRVAQSP